MTIIVESDTETDVSRALGNEALTFSAHSEASAEGQQGLRQGNSLRTSEVALTLVSLMLTMPCVSVMSGARVGQAALGAPQDCWQGHGALESLRPPTHSHLHRARVEDVCQVRKWVLARAACHPLLACRAGFHLGSQRGTQKLSGGHPALRNLILQCGSHGCRSGPQLF